MNLVAGAARNLLILARSCGVFGCVWRKTFAGGACPRNYAHLVLSDVDLAATEVSQRDVSNAVVSLTHDCSRSRMKV